MFLYFLKDRSGPYRKIGIAVDVKRRISQLPDEIDRDSSYIVECFKGSSGVERSLHHLFSEFRIKKEHGRDGHTEWFAEECFDSIQRFIEENRTILGVGPFLPLPSYAPKPDKEPLQFRWPGEDVKAAKLAAIQLDFPTVSDFMLACFHFGIGRGDGLAAYMETQKRRPK